MNSVLQQIKVAYEVAEMTPEEIAADQELDIASVKAALMQGSSKYRKACGEEDEDEDGLNFSDRELREVNKVIFMAATQAENADGSPDWRTRSQNAQYIRDDKKGRKEVVKNMAGNTFNILSFNETLKQVKDMKRKFIDVGEPG